jgi:hypothetical protein
MEQEQRVLVALRHHYMTKASYENKTKKYGLETHRPILTILASRSILLQ